MAKLSSIKQSFSVHHEYALHFTHGLFTKENTLLKSIFNGFSDTPTKCIAIVDNGVADAHGSLVNDIKQYAVTYNTILTIEDVIVVEGGEMAKANKNAYEKVLNAINDNAICRHSFVLAIGGGAVLDMAGYAASTAHRGVKIIRIPTTVLSQNDAAVGVKNGINYFGKKNFLGAFTPPFAIINDLNFLTTLEQRDWIAGIAEAVKVALIKDGEFFNFLEANAKAMANREMEPMAQQIHRCAELHMQHIAQGGDPFESGSSRPLDFGHWSAHKLEQMTDYKLRHGEAVAMGIGLDVTYSHLIGLISKETKSRILSLMNEIGFTLQLPLESNEIDELLKGLEEFREHLGGELTITLIKGIGKKHDVHEIDEKLMREAINERKTEKVFSL